MIGAFKSSMLHDVVYQQQMANALAQQLSRDFADSFGKQVGAAVVNSLQLWQQQAVIENRQEFSMLMDAGLSDACERTGTYVAQSPQRIRIDPAAHPESQRQQQRSSVRNQQQQQNLTRETEFDSPNQRMDVSSQRMHHQPNPVYSSVPTFRACDSDFAAAAHWCCLSTTDCGGRYEVNEWWSGFSAIAHEYFCCVLGIRNLVPAEIADEHKMTLNEVSKFDDFFEFGKTLKEGSGSLMERATL